jgi:large subunit ribosomal protein L30
MARLRITYVKSAIGYNVKQKLTIQALGLRKLQQTVEHDDSPAIRGMVNKVPHLVRVERFEPTEEPDAETTTQEAASR